MYLGGNRRWVPLSRPSRFHKGRFAGRDLNPSQRNVLCCEGRGKTAGL